MEKDPGNLIITGKVLNYDSEESQIKFVIGRLSFPPEEVDVKPDTSGQFYISFNVYIPSDVNIISGNSFYL